MSTCWKCGRELPGGEVDCGACSDSERAPESPAEALETLAEALEKINSLSEGGLALGSKLARMLVDHLERVGANGIMVPVTSASGARYKVSVMPMAKGESV